jgi:hypothetical protein
MLARSMILAAVALAALATGCGGSGADGGDGEGGSIETSSLSKTQFIKRATELCQRERAGIVRASAAYVAEHQSDGLPAGELAASGVQEVVMPVVEAQIEAVRELGAPAGDEAEVGAMLEAQQDAVDRVKELETMNPNEGVVEHFEQAIRAYEAYGLNGCRYNL